MTRIIGITFGVPVRNLNEGVAWYRRLIGNTKEIKPAPGVWECEIFPLVWLQLFERASGGSNPAIIRFESENINASRDFAKRLSSNVGDIQVVPGAVRYFEFQDPFGNQVSFYEIGG